MRGQGGRPRIYGKKHAGRDEEDDEEEKGEEGRKAGGMEGTTVCTRKEELREGQETR